MLATRFNRRAPVIRAAHGILTEDQIRTIVPSIFAEEAHDVEGEVKANPFTGA